MIEEREFGELLSYPLRSGFTVPAANRGSGIRMVNMGELFKYPRIPDVEMARVELSTTDAERSLLQHNDLLFARRSLSLEGAGKCSIVKEVDEPTTWEGSILRARIDRTIAYAPYYYYYFSSPQGRQRIETIVEQVAAAGIRGSDLNRLHVPCPDLRAQHAIAQLLSALDDKIGANTNLINTADELSHAIYRTMAGGSRNVPLSETAQFINGKAFTKGASGTGRVVIRIAELNSGIGGSTVYSDIDVPDQHVARPGDLLFAWSGSLTLHRWFRREAIVNQHIFKVIPNDGYPMWLVYELVRHKLEEFKAIAADKATTMGHIQRKHLDEPVPVPSPAQIAAKDKLMTTLWRRGLEAQVENEKLAVIRDSLLPILMTGRLQIDGVESNIREEFTTNEETAWPDKLSSSTY